MAAQGAFVVPPLSIASPPSLLLRLPRAPPSSRLLFLSRRSSSRSRWAAPPPAVSRRPREAGKEEADEDHEERGEEWSRRAKGSGMTARGRRLLRVREEKRKREYDRLHNYPAWAKILEDACKDDMELRAVLGDSIGNPELMRKRVEDRVRKKGRDFHKSKTGSVLAFKVSFRE